MENYTTAPNILGFASSSSLDCTKGKYILEIAIFILSN